MDLIDLIPDLDEVATAEKVKKFFDKDLERLLRLADKQRSFFRSVSMDGMPKAPSPGNGQENMVVKYVSSESAKAKSILEDVSVALNHCSNTYQLILYYRYIEGLADWQVAQKVQYSTARYYQLKIAACIEFAERLCVQRNKIDLRVKTI
ncbi:ArpU family phage packaging/lysis transcriptional regulator [uncultured Ligilactobacillus sp.]|uniref:ArpU family phage packaging/lysis transcriptional regulator n=1 Tax=uncultured Ligilactobacillus sp. TaxID=2837633 RepID=UPI00272B531C|nr:ArpU family phage packaging/lysis transcriptional regulator [uncultured Ligilactobacillus sp.]